MATTAQPSRQERIRNDVFPGAEHDVFDTSTKGFVPVPLEFRRLLRHLTASQTRVLLYLQLRASKEGICFPAVEEIAHDLGVTPKHVRPHLRELERKGFLRMRAKGGKTYYLLHDPAIAIRKLVDLKEIGSEELREINNLREDLKRDPIQENC